ncbi:DHH family phosphoesterase [Helcococcus sueciensis]|uniref:DHH family phosphoesterase n=1 Tax=Helcococcus sueciensis TaxID=241555 RepID=UPI00040342AD|nr:DHH family phosphoesterase [Helcococcus sueciensis]
MNKIFRKENMPILISPLINIVLTIILMVLNVYIGIGALILTIISIYNAYDTIQNKNEQFKKYADSLDLALDGFSKKTIFNMPFSIVVIDNKKDIVWYNSKFKQLINEKESVVDDNIHEVFPEITDELLKIEQDSFMINYLFKDYEVHKTTLDDQKMTLLYFIDSTDREQTRKKYQEERLALMNIRIDNYEELNSDVSSEKRPILYAEIDSTITSYFHEHGSFIKKNENGRYFAVLYKATLNQMIIEKFSFIDKVRNINTGNTIVPTLSIGIGIDEESVRDNEKSANAALDIALGRGGDQIVLKAKDNLQYFGGKSQATEKRTKVKARVIAHALSQLIEKSTDVYISGHINPDMDSFGSALGLWYAVKKKNKSAYIVLNEVTPAIKNIYNYSTTNIKELKDCIISPEEAYERAKASSLVIVTDNHRKQSIEEPRLFEKTDSIVVIDHHRRGNDYIENAILSYVEPSSSSASELVTEMLMYMDEKVSINKFISDALLAGITVDTKNFNQQTGIRTFEAAAILKQNGADSTVVTKLFRDDFQTLKFRSQIISDSIIYKDKYIIGTFDKDIEESTLIASQSADEMMNIENIKASFVLTKSKNKTHISARSYGEISVQLIMEKLDGGGHQNMAATQLDVSIPEAIDLLKKAIKEYESEDEK